MRQHPRPTSRSALLRLPWRGLWLTLAASAALGNAAKSAPYYEAAPPYRFGTGGASLRGSVDVATGAFRIQEKLATLTGRVPGVAAWFYNSQDATNGPLGKGTSLPYDYFVAKATTLPGQPYERRSSRRQRPPPSERPPPPNAPHQPPLEARCTRMP
jgi:hypothetical protein